MGAWRLPGSMRALGEAEARSLRTDDATLAHTHPLFQSTGPCRQHLWYSGQEAGEAADVLINLSALICMSSTAIWLLSVGLVSSTGSQGQEGCERCVGGGRQAGPQAARCRSGGKGPEGLRKV